MPYQGDDLQLMHDTLTRFGENPDLIAIDVGRDRCRYRATLEDGSVVGCAIGCHIADEDYTPNMEGLGGANHIFDPLFPNTTPEGRREAQILHDGALDSGDIRNMARSCLILTALECGHTAEEARVAWADDQEMQDAMVACVWADRRYAA